MLFRTYYLMQNAHDIFNEVSYHLKNITEFSIDDFKNHEVESFKHTKNINDAMGLLLGYEYINKKLNKLIKVLIKYSSEWSQLKYSKIKK